MDADLIVGATALAAKRVCCRCGRQRPCGPNGWCSLCEFNRKIRAGQARPSKSRRHATATAPLPAEPTSAGPGSEEKIRILAERADRGEQLFHPQDDRTG